MSRYARIIDAVAVEVWTDGGLGIVPADVFVPDLAAQFEPVPAGVQAGWSLIDGIWVAPPEPVHTPFVPQEVSMRQAKVALHLKNLLSHVNSAIENSDNEVTKIEWQYAQTLRRDWPALQVVAGVLELTAEDTDNLFIFANTL